MRHLLISLLVVIFSTGIGVAQNQSDSTTPTATATATATFGNYLITDIGTEKVAVDVTIEFRSLITSWEVTETEVTYYHTSTEGVERIVTVRCNTMRAMPGGIYSSQTLTNECYRRSLADGMLPGVYITSESGWKTLSVVFKENRGDSEEAFIVMHSTNGELTYRGATFFPRDGDVVVYSGADISKQFELGEFLKLQDTIHKGLTFVDCKSLFPTVSLSQLFGEKETNFFAALALKPMSSYYRSR